MKPCRGGKHSLEVISKASIDSHSDCVIRWCSYCGAIVEDQEIDGRLVGQYEKMRFPEITLNACKNKAVQGNEV